ncbi:SDR family oxidoreductase [Thalassoroseus pseudoceratinae]|uniref:SDR family oxidoreductase n=1 Tax=Thalassoroseus pseudoceratinae TaxID=2713176 RepID=UPI00142466AF|nr:SDR family oxidoreductase [Thalassoroseus pseudoceratinae]
MSRTIVITGATRGLGRNLVDRFVESGQTVVGCGRSESAVAELREQYGSPHAFAAVDVTDDASVQQWCQSVLDSHGPPDLLINNAAIINRSAPLWEITVDEFSQIVNINIVGVANVLRGFVPRMNQRGEGVIVNLSSGWGRSTSPEVAPYCATKFAIEGLTKALAQELPSGLAAIPLNPGIIDTDMLRSAFGSAAGSYPNAEQWSRTAAPFLLELGPRDNGESLTVPH